MKVYEISYFKNKYPILFSIFSKIIPTLSLIFIFIVFGSGYFAIHNHNSIYFYVLFFIVISFYMWWLIRWFEYIFLLLSWYVRYKAYQKLNLENVVNGTPKLKMEKIYYKKYKKSNLKIDDLYHWVIIPTFQDPYDMLKDSFESIKNSKYDNKKIIVTLAGEENDLENFRKIEEKFLTEYKDVFYFINTTIHPKNIEWELPWKWSNVSYSAKQTYRKILSMGINPENVLVSVMDSESVVQDIYFITLSLEYCILDENMRDKTIFQPMLFLFNRFFNAPFFSKVIALSTTFYILAASIKWIWTRAQAVQAQSLKSLLFTNFYSSETITEDGHQYYRTYCAFDGNFQVHPIYTYVLLEPVIWKTFFESLKLQYNQIKRWAHGMLDFPYIVLCLIENKKLPKFRTFYEIFWLLEVSVLWSSLQFILFMWTIFFSFLWGKYSHLLQIITFISLIVLLILMVVTFMFLPWKILWKKTLVIYEIVKYTVFSFTIMWPLLFILSWVPALHSQLLILIWKPMWKFNVTKKYR